jgi:hypothetical protein
MGQLSVLDLLSQRGAAGLGGAGRLVAPQVLSPETIIPQIAILPLKCAQLTDSLLRPFNRG